MKYLYGDSAPFPYTFDFLATLERFLTSATMTVQLESESRSLEVTTAAMAASRVRTLEELQSFHDAVIRAIQDSGSKRAGGLTNDYVHQLVDHANMRLEEARQSVTAANDREQASVRIDVDRRRGEIRQAIESFMTSARLPTSDLSVSVQLAEGQYRATAILSHPGSIVSDFQLAPGRIPGWLTPRRVGDITPNMSLTVGLKRGLFRRGSQLEQIVVDDYVVSGFMLSEHTADIRLRKKATDPRDAVIFRLQRRDMDLLAEVMHPGEEGADTMNPVDPNDRLQLTRLWDALALAGMDLVEHRDRLLTLRVEGEEVFENDLAIVFIERIVSLLAPTVGEVAKRSPNAQELSLKRETDAGRREELYVKKSELVSKIALLGDKERSIFGPLGLAPDVGVGMPSEQEINLEPFEEDD